MNKPATIIAAICMGFLVASCGGGDTGEGYNSNDTADFNTSPDAMNIDSSVSPMAGDRGNPDSALNTNTTDTGRTNINNDGNRSR